jgi:AAA domain
VTAQLGTFEELVDLCTVRLGAGQRSGRSWRFVCPLHDDVNPSLNISPGDDGEALAYCHGCADGRVYERLLDWLRDGDQTSPIPGKPKGTGNGRAWSDAPLGRVVGQYEYRDADGQPVALKLRYDPKDFRWRGWRGGGYMDTGLGNVDRLPCLYRLHKLAERAKQTGELTLVEGEKDADRLWALGVAATCTPYGSTWPVEGAVEFIAGLGVPVRVIRDKDPAGFAWAAGLRRDLIAAGVSPSVWETPLDIKGADVSDHLDDGLGLDELVPVDEQLGDDEGAAAPIRRLVLTSAADIKTRRVTWLWDARLAVGILALLAGREGLGKSSFAYWLVARVTRGELPGEHQGHPRAVLISATEDSWEHTVVPRLVAVGADLSRIFRIEMQTADATLGLSLPRDNAEVEVAARKVGAALLLLDPLISRISTALNTNVDPEVRQALEPLTGLADRVGMTALGIIHLNKTASVDILDRVMGSKAFAAVARAVCAVVADPDDPTNRARLFGVPKNNLGRDDLPSIRFTIEGTPVGTDDGEISDVGRAVIGDETVTTIREAMERNGDDDDVRSLTAECKDWLRQYLTDNSHADSRDVKRDGAAAGFSESTINRARKVMRVVVTNLSQTPRRTVWSLPPAGSGLSNGASRARGDAITGMTNINAGQSVSGGQGDTTTDVSRVSDVMPTREVK